MVVEKREQVFVSSTYVDLQEERQAVIQTLLEADCFPAGMELFPASDEEKWDLIKRVIDDSDYYVVIVGGRYGSLDDSGLSFTEKEFDYAVETKTPVLGFLHGAPGSIVADKMDLDPALREKLEAFREKVSKRMVKFWSSPSDLAGAVARSLIQARKYHPAEGWVRARGALTPEVEQEMAELRATVEKLNAELEAQRHQQAEGVDVGELAQGEDVHMFNTLLYYWTPADVQAGRTWPAKRQIHSKNYRVTWDNIFSILAPLMLDEASEVDLSEELDFQATFLRDDDPEVPEEVGEVDRVMAGPDVLNKIKVQLFALGLIGHSQKRHPVQDQNSYWTLTQKGRDHLMRLSAERRPEPAQQAIEI
ncbi:DUF4062 domain-containing protein [Geodermatophilus marinus]|uniref:DUF4062 domain-containing protein n=1 Tax=Geodermatophilus sp. LHW52908 TaxID=2303986 RepID=UPI0013148D5B|nr:DUF4062 domain-containing protein [Geodermatophilus sp. LHW52908]